MQHVRVELDANGREAKFHPVWNLLTNSSFIERGAALQWNYTGQSLGIILKIQGDKESFVNEIETFPEIADYELEPVESGLFFVYISDKMTGKVQAGFEIVSAYPVVVLPPVVFTESGKIACSFLGSQSQVQTVIDGIPDSISITIQEVTGMAGASHILNFSSILTDRQWDALQAAYDLGYYDIPRKVGHEQVADAIGCAPSTAAEHLRKAESELVRLIISD